MTLNLTTAQHRLLADALRSHLDALEVELSRTEHREFRHALRLKVDELEEIWRHLRAALESGETAYA